MWGGSVVCWVLDVGVAAPDGGRAPRRRPQDACQPWLDNGLDLACFFLFSVGDLNLTCMLQLVLSFFWDQTPYILIL
jgi:hypothetical protein